MSTNQNTRSIHRICVKRQKMADEREDREATFQFIEEVQNCPDLWDVSSAACKDTKNKRVVRPKGGISTDIRFRPKLSIFLALSVSFSAINIQ